MSVRQNFGKIDGHRFEKTSTERGGVRHYIDGKPVKRDVWQERLSQALDNSSANKEAAA